MYSTRNCAQCQESWCPITPAFGKVQWWSKGVCRQWPMNMAPLSWCMHSKKVGEAKDMTHTWDHLAQQGNSTRGQPNRPNFDRIPPSWKIQPCPGHHSRRTHRPLPTWENRLGRDPTRHFFPALRKQTGFAMFYTAYTWITVMWSKRCKWLSNPISTNLRIKILHTCGNT